MNKYYIFKDCQFTIYTEGNTVLITGTKQGRVLSIDRAKELFEKLQANHIATDTDMFVCMDINPLDVPSTVGATSGYYTEIPYSEVSRKWVTENSGTWCLVDSKTRQVKEVSAFNQEYYKEQD